MAKAKVSNELEIVYLKKIYLSKMTSVFLTLVPHRKVYFIWMVFSWLEMNENCKALSAIFAKMLPIILFKIYADSKLR